MTERLQRLCALIEPTESFIDVGCDHGYVAQYVADRKLAGRIAACDISAASLKKAERLIGRNAGVEFICADGRVAAQGYETVLIGGMGGRETVAILKGCTPNTAILSPQSQVSSVRDYLLHADYAVTDDAVLRDGRKYYDVIRAKRGGGKAQLAAAHPLQLQFGMFLHIRNDCLLRRLTEWRAALETYPPTRENIRKLQNVKEAISWQLR